MTASAEEPEEAAIEQAAPRHDIPTGGRSGFVMADERQVHYLEWGSSSAPTVCCLHGGGQTAYMWEELGSTLGDRYHVVAPDLPGHGDSDLLVDDALDRVVLAESIPPFLAEFGVERAAFVGASLGGIASITLAARRPELVGAIALIDIGHRLEDEGVNRIVDFMSRHESFESLDEAAEAVREYLPQRRNVRPASLRRNLRERDDGRWEWKHPFGRKLRQAGTLASKGGWRGLVAGMDDEARGLTCPVLVLRGASSDVLSDEGAEEIAALIPDARMATVHGAGHHAAGDEPESTTGLVATFLRDLEW